MNTDRETKARLLWFLLACIGLFILVALIDPWSVFRQPFRTQTILFRDMAAPEHRVEFQMQDVGALGYNRQVVEIRPFMFFFETSVPFDSTLNSNTKWVRVNEEVNELGIRYP